MPRLPSDPLRCGGPQPAARSRFAGFSLVELLVVVATIAGLTALLLPAVQMGRESARKAACQNNLRQIGIGLHNFHAARDFFPTTVSGSGARHYWGAQILPYMDENPIASMYDYTVACNDIKNRAAVLYPLPFMNCASKPGGPIEHPKFKVSSPTMSAAAADYCGSTGPSATLWTGSPPVLPAPQPSTLDGLFAGTIKPGQKGRGMRMITDGASKTVAVFESAGRPQVWAFGRQTPGSGLLSSPSTPARRYYVLLSGWADANQNDVWGFAADTAQTDPALQYAWTGGQMINGSNTYGIYAFHPGGANLLMVDGGVQFAADTSAPGVVAAQLTAQAGD